MQGVALASGSRRRPTRPRGAVDEAHGAFAAPAPPRACAGGGLECKAPQAVGFADPGVVALAGGPGEQDGGSRAGRVANHQPVGAFVRLLDEARRQVSRERHDGKGADAAVRCGGRRPSTGRGRRGPHRAAGRAVFRTGSRRPFPRPDAPARSTKLPSAGRGLNGFAVRPSCGGWARWRSAARHVLLSTFGDDDDTVAALTGAGPPGGTRRRRATAGPWRPRL